MEIGQTLNQRYRLTAAIGKGAMGTVYRATDAQTGQDVAVKVIARALALDSDMLERFRREGEALRQLRHPNIVGFVDMFIHEGQHLIVMEYVPGGSLHNALRQGPLSIDRTRRMALELCDALTRAHHLNIIHRDLKPENVLLTADGSPKLTDFGVARLVDEGTRLTGTGAQVGTPFYMSPEAWEGKPLDAQTDIWSLGIMLYEMLSGQVPFNGDTVVAVMNKVLNAPLPDLAALRRDVPPGLAQIIQRMLEREKSQRYQSMREVGADLERGQPLAALTAVPGYRSAETRVKAQPALTRAQARVSSGAAAPAIRRPIWPWIAGGVAILALLGLGGLGLGAGWLLFGRAPAAPAASPVPPTATAPPTSGGPSTVAPPTAVKPPTALPPTAPVVKPASDKRPTCGPGETELFFDDFEHGLASGWAFGDVNNQPIPPWPVVADGSNHVLEGTGHFWATRPGAPDVALQVRVRRLTPDGTANINIRTGPDSRYYVGYYPQGILVRTPPSHPAGAQLAEFALGNDTAWHTVRLAATGHHVEVSVDSKIVAQADDPSGPVEGGLGLENTSGTLWYDDVLACKLAGAGASVGASQKLSIGVLLPMSGPNASFGLSARDGVQMAVDEWNGQGGLLGAMIMPVVADGQCEGNPAVAAAKQLISAGQVHYLIGELCSKASIPVSAIAESEGVVEISPASTSAQVTLNSDGSTKAYVFRACFVDEFQGKVMANFARSQNFEQAFVIYDQGNPYSSGLAKYFMFTFQKSGGKLAGNAPYSSDTQDFGPILDKVAASQAQVLYVPDFSTRVNLIAQQAKKQGLTAVLMGGDGWEGGDLDLAALNGGYYTTGYSPLGLNAAGQDWAQRYRAQYGRDPDAFAALSYDAAKLLFTAIQQAGVDDPPRVKDILAGLHFEGVTGALSFDAQHNPVKSAVIMQVKDGQRVYVGTVPP